MIRIKIKKIYGLVLLMGAILTGCIEPFDVSTQDFESVLVVEGVLTNELKNHEILLSQSFEFDSVVIPEQNASVRVLSSSGMSYDYQEESPGLYRSSEMFNAQDGENYQLLITRNNGASYSSPNLNLPANASIDVSATRTTNDAGEQGVAILANSFNPEGEAQNYRYIYEETYKIIAPNWTAFKLVGDPEGGCNVLVELREEQQRVCFATQLSNTIIQTNTTDLEEDRVTDQVVRFIKDDDYIISHRYSILVKQLIQSDDAFNFYNRLNEFSSSESLFSETQPGFLVGNITADANQNENVLGFFEVASVNSQRIFFNYSDLYGDAPLPPYVDTCSENAPPLTSENGSCILRAMVEVGTVSYVTDNSPEPGEGPYLVVPRVCGDCTVLGSNQIPEFWIE